MTRQLDAQYIDIDTDGGYVKFAIMDPVPIEFGKVEQAAEDAAYTLSVFELQLRGHTQPLDCGTCEAGGLAFEVLGTGQLFELVGEVPTDRNLLIKANVTGWAGKHPLLEVLEFSEL